MPIRILDAGATINLKIDGESNYIDKEFDVNINNDIVWIRENNGKSWEVPFDEVEVPSVANIEALAAFIEGLKETGGGGTTNVDITGNTVGLSTESKQDVGNASLATIQATFAPGVLDHGSANDITDLTSTEVLAAPGAGFKWVIATGIVTNDHAIFRTKVKILSAATELFKQSAGSEGGGFIIPLGMGIEGGENEAINAQCVTIGADVDVVLSAYKVAV